MANHDRLALGAALNLETRLQTILFWSSVAIVAASLVVVRYPPLIDYPQHLALVALMNRIADGSVLETQRYDVQWLTYNSFFHVLAALLGRVLALETAGKLVLFIIPWLTAAAQLALLRLLERPTAYAFMVVPVLYGHVLGWGFLNFAFGAPLCALTLVTWARFWHFKSGRPMAVALLAMLVAWVHPFAYVALGLGSTVLFLSLERPEATRPARSPILWARAVAEAAAPFLPSILLAVFLYLRHMASPTLWFDEVSEGSDVPAWTKLLEFPRFATGNFKDGSDALLVWLALGLVLAAWGYRYAKPVSPAASEPRGRLRARRAFATVACLWLVLYVCCPQVLFSTGFVFERFALLAWLFLPLCLPALPQPLEKLVGTLSMVLGVAGALNVAWQMTRIEHGDEATAVIDAIPEHSRVVGLIFARRGDTSLYREIWTHLPAYALIRRRCEIAFDFARYASLPVNERDSESQPPVLPGGFEWHPESYDPMAGYARYYNWVLVASDEPDPSAQVFGAWSERARLVAHEGRFFLYQLHRF